MLLTPRRSIVVVALAGLLGASCAQLRDLPTLKQSDLSFKLAQSSRIVASNGRLITTLHGAEDRTIIPLKAIPRHLQRAVVAIEDERFYKHEGVDLKAVVRAALANVSEGAIREGGSTITQQYVKNYIIAPGAIAEKSLERKIDEAALARQLEKRLSKNEILWRYLNTVYFGNGAYGVQAAAKTYFGKHAGKLNLRESATLAGLIRSPETYDPIDAPDAARRRRNTVLSKMGELGWAPRAQVARALRQKLKLRPGADRATYPAPYFVDYVQRLVTFDPRFKALGATAEDRTNSLFQGGLRIETTVDLKMQKAAEDAIASVLTQKNDPHGALVAVDPKSGHVKAMVGGRDWFAGRKKDRFAKLNLATVAEPGLGCVKVPGRKRCERRAPGTGRQAGSAFKPFALAAALDQGTSLSEVFQADDCASFPSVNWDRVCNYEESAFGKVSLLEATVKSINVVYAQLILNGEPFKSLKNAKPTTCELCDETVAIARDMGIDTLGPPESSAVPSAVLGSNPVNALGMASAFSTFATNGVHHPPVAITRIVAPNGKVLYRDTSEPKRAIDAGIAYLTTTALEQVIQRGTGTGGQIGRPAAGKTGTAQEYRDAWFGGYTPDLAAAVWVGYPERSIEMKTSCAGSSNPCRPTRIQVTGGSWPTDIWRAFMSRALQGVPARNFTKPDISLITVTIDTRNGCLADRFTPPEYRASATFQKGTQPEETCREKGQLQRVPDLFGFPVDDATRILEDAGFDVAIVREASESYPPGRVIGQSPDGGSRARLGSTVTLVVSKNANEVERATVPTVLGMTRRDAEARLREEGFDVDVVMKSEGSGAKKRKGRVWKQRPAGGTRADYGSTVTIWVNPG